MNIYLFPDNTGICIYQIYLGSSPGSNSHEYFGGWASQVAPVVKNVPANAGDVSDAVSVPGLGRSPGEGHGNPLQNSCLEHPMDKGALQTRL